MAELIYTEAAKFAGISRATLYRHIKQGRVSASTNKRGENVIDTSELVRVYGEPESHETSYNTPQRNAVQRDTDRHETGEIVPILKKQITFLEKQLDDAKEREMELLEIVKQQTRLLEDKRDEKPRKPAEPETYTSPPTRGDSPVVVWLLVVAILVTITIATVTLIRADAIYGLELLPESVHAWLADSVGLDWR